MRRIEVDLSERAYSVTVGAGTLDELAGLSEGREKVLVVGHDSLRRLSDRVRAVVNSSGVSVTVLEVADGETSKTWERAGELLDQMARAGTHRGDLVVTVGGGVISDLGGFVASVFARGLDVVHVPTSLLGQVDAAIGGKTGVNLDSGKNLVGTFHQPIGVICDTDLLATLPEEEFRAGLAEVIKCGIIRDPSILNAIEEGGGAVRGDAALVTELVAATVAVKAAIVAADEREAGVRAVLNYGHTFAHAIELAEGFGSIRHGEAVSLGMVAAGHLAAVLGRIDDEVVRRHTDILQSVGLPVAANLDYERLEPGFKMDKKYDSGIRFVLLGDQGRPEPGILVERQDVERALERMKP